MLGAVLLERLKDPDFVVRSAAAGGLGALKPAGGAAALRDAFAAAQADSAYGARGAILQALVGYGPAESTATLKTALTDKDWAIRVRAAELLKTHRAWHPWHLMSRPPSVRRPAHRSRPTTTRCLSRR